MHLFGAEPSRTSHVVELGCGDGHFLIHQAFMHPEMTFWGIDYDPQAVKKAHHTITSLNLKNIEIVCGDIAEMGCVKSADIVYVHGLFSWVDETTQSAIIEKLSHSTHEGSVIIVSCNILPGFQMRSIVHQYFERFGDLQDDALCLNALENLKKVAPYEFEKPYGLLLHQEISKLESGSIQYIREEFLKSPRAFYLSEIAQLFGRCKFSLLGDARFQRNFSWRGLNYDHSDLVKAEEFFDFAFGTPFRELVFVSGPTKKLKRESIKNLSFTSSLETVSLSEDFDISPLQEALRNVWPHGYSYQQLIEEGFSIDEVWEHLIHEKIDGVIMLSEHPMTDRPHAPLCFQTSRQFEWANGRYEPVHVSAFDDAVLRQCDGSREINEISSALISFMGDDAPSIEEMQSAVFESLKMLKKALLI